MEGTPHVLGERAGRPEKLPLITEEIEVPGLIQNRRLPAKPDYPKTLFHCSTLEADFSNTLDASPSIVTLLILSP